MTTPLSAKSRIERLEKQNKIVEHQNTIKTLEATNDVLKEQLQLSQQSNSVLLEKLTGQSVEIEHDVLIEKIIEEKLQGIVYDKMHEDDFDADTNLYEDDKIVIEEKLVPQISEDELNIKNNPEAVVSLSHEKLPNTHEKIVKEHVEEKIVKEPVAEKIVKEPVVEEPVVVKEHVVVEKPVVEEIEEDETEFPKSKSSGRPKKGN